MKELTELARKGKPLYGVTGESPWIQSIAYRNSQWSQLMFRTSSQVSVYMRSRGSLQMLYHGIACLS